MPLETAFALARASSRAAAAGSGGFAAASTARSSICAGLISKRSPAAARILPRISLFDASTSGCGSIQRGITEFPSKCRRAPALGQKPHYGRGGLLDRPTRHLNGRPATPRAQAPGERYFLGDCHLVDILVVVAMGPKTKQPILADLHDPLRAGVRAHPPQALPFL